MFRKKRIFLVAILMVSGFFLILRYLITILPGTEIQVGKKPQVEEAIYKILETLSEYYKVPHQLNSTKITSLLNSLQVDGNLQLNNLDFERLWEEANAWPMKNRLVDISSSAIGKLMYVMKNAVITKADVDTRGTQLKLLLDLGDDRQVIFKPKWYDKEKIIEGPVYAGKDRFGSEIVAFYLSLLLEKPLTPISVERTISLKYDIVPVATKRLLNTSFEMNRRTCIYGKCFYCKKEDPICDDENNLLTGAVIFNIKKSFSNYRSPWQRTYKTGKTALWEEDTNYCRMVKSKLSKKKLLDIIDTSIFDFLIQNGDRHHFETFDNNIIWIDNGKGLGNPYVHHIDILAPLYQCCMIRDNTWKTLQSFAGGNLGKLLRLMPDIQSVLSEAHLNAIEERLTLVFATVEYCKLKKI